MPDDRFSMTGSTPNTAQQGAPYREWDGVQVRLCEMMTDAPSETDLLLEQHVLLGTVAGGARSVDVFADGAADWHGPKMPGAAGFFPAGRRMKSRWPGTRLTYIKLAIRPQATEELLHFKVAEALAADPADRLAALSAETLATSLHLHLASRFSSLRISYGAACEGLGRALDLIHASLPRTVSLGEMVEASNLPRARFLLAFARQTGFSPHRYILRERMARARLMLETTRIPVGEVALVVGCANAGHLTRLYQSHYGNTPLAWRQRHSRS